MSVDNRTRALVQALRRASDVRLYISRVEELSYHLLEFPETRLVAVKVRHSKSTKFFFFFVTMCLNVFVNKTAQELYQILFLMCVGDVVFCGLCLVLVWTLFDLCLVLVWTLLGLDSF